MSPFYTGKMIQKSGMNLSESANTVCVLEKCFNDRMYQQSTQLMI